MRRCFECWQYLLVVAVVLLSNIALAQGGPPVITDDPGTPGAGHWETNLGLTAEVMPHVQTYELPVIDVNYGLGARIQLAFETPWLVQQDGGTLSGPGSSIAGMKWRFVDEKQHRFSMSVYPQFTFNLLSDSARRGLVEGASNLFFPIEFETEIVGRARICLEAGGVFGNAQDSAWVYGLLLKRRVSKRLELLAELHDSYSLGSRTDAMVINFGGRWGLTKRYTLLGSLGTGIRGASDEKAALLSYIGIRSTY
jgi:hypothetical protein